MTPTRLDEIHKRHEQASSGIAGLQKELIDLHATNLFLRNVLRDAARQFRSYELSHRKKQTVDGDMKAETNASFAKACESAAQIHSDRGKLLAYVEKLERVALAALDAER